MSHLIAPQFKKIIKILPLLWIGIYLLSFLGSCFVFVTSFVLNTYLCIVILIYTLFFICIKSVLRNLSNSILYHVIPSCLTFFVLGGWLLNFYFLPHKFHPVSLTVNIVFLVLTITIGVFFIASRKLKAFLFCFMVCCITFISFMKNQYTPSKMSTLQQLQSLPYLGYVVNDRNPLASGVTLHDKQNAAYGVNLYTSHKLPDAYIVDMDGQELHRWTVDDIKGDWQFFRLIDNGDIIVVIKDTMLLKLDWHSQIIWQVKGRFHHEVNTDGNKDIYALSRKDEIVFDRGLPVPILNDYITFLSPDGIMKQSYSLHKLLGRKIPFEEKLKIYSYFLKPLTFINLLKGKFQYGYMLINDTPPDIYHTNALYLIDKDYNHNLKKGSYLFCMKMLHKIGILNLESQSVTWEWGKNTLEFPHYPTILKSGNVLIYDNGSFEREFTKIIELDTMTGNIDWEYSEFPREEFFSFWGGANQSLPNGNILITDSESGRVFEITKNGKKVWEFYNPITYQEDKRATIYRMLKITDSQFLSRINQMK